MPSRPWPPFLDPQDVLRHPDAWRQIGRSEALRLEAQGAVIAVMSGTSPAVMRFDENSPFHYTCGPYDYASLRYYLHLGTGPSMPGTLGGAKRAVKPKEEAPQEDEELVPLESEEEEPESSPSPARKQEVAKEDSKEEEVPTEVLELRFDLALDPATPGLEDDIFVLEGLDSEYRQAKSVRDDKVAGDGKLTLVFTEVEKGKAYRLSQQTGEAELLLVSEVVCEGHPAEKGGAGGEKATRAAPGPGVKASGATAQGPGEVIGCKAVFRECRIRGDKEDFWKEKETEYLIELAPIVGKWIYVLGGPQGGKMNLIAEGVGISGGKFRPVDLAKQKNRNKRDPSPQAVAWMTLPLRVNGRSWNLYACLSPIQLPWKRVQQLLRAPSPRCYRIGESAGGVVRVPDPIAKAIADLGKARDARVPDPGNDIVVVGLIDPMAEAKRRAALFQRDAEACLEARFDPPDAVSKTKVSITARRKKLVAGMLKVLVETHPDRERLRKSLAENGRSLERYLREENDREILLRNRMEKSAAALVKWLDNPSGLFEAALKDHSADPGLRENLEAAEEDYSYLVRYFEAASITRLYGQKIQGRKDSWLNSDWLSEDVFGAARKITQASVEILSWVGRVIVQRKDFNLRMMETLYRLYVPGMALEPKAVTNLEYKSLVADFFPDERVGPPTPRLEKYWQALESPTYRRQVEVLWFDRHSQPAKALLRGTDSRLVKALLMGFEGANLLYTAKPEPGQESYSKIVAGIGAMSDGSTILLESIRVLGRKAGRGFLSGLGCLSAACDLYLAHRKADEELTFQDYDAMAAQVVVAAGSASLAVGTATIAYTVFSSVAWSGGILNTLFTAGAGISATGAGAPVGAALFLTGAFLAAAGSLAYAILNDSALETWIKQCPFGVMPMWSLDDDRVAPPQIWELSRRLFPWKLEARHAYLNGQSDYRISLQGHFNVHTKVIIHALDFVDGNGKSTRFMQDVTLKPLEMKGLTVSLTLENPPTLNLCFADAFCWEEHRKKHPGAGRGFKACRIHLTIDQRGDGQILWPTENRDKAFQFAL